MNILLLSAYNTQSHNYWCKLLKNKINDHKWTFLSLPPRKFSWRIRGNALSWMSSNKKELLLKYDSIIATSMVDFSTLIGLFPNLGKANKILYFHENQFEYPLSKEKNHSNVESMMVNLYGALAADRVVFNSAYNRSSFYIGAEKLLKRINDHCPISILDDIRSKDSIIPVPICNRVVNNNSKIKNSIIWNHRWEYDKNPKDYYKTLKILKDKKIDFKLIMMGIQFKNSPPIFTRIKEEFKEHILCWGEQSREDYISWLLKGEFIISTAIHEFQGLAVMEGVQYGAIPIVPNRLSYPEWFPKEFLYGETPAEMSLHIINSFIKKQTLPDLSQLTWESLEIRYRKLIK